MAQPWRPTLQIQPLPVAPSLSAVNCDSGAGNSHSQPTPKVIMTTVLMGLKQSLEDAKDTKIQRDLEALQK